ncbi:uncharacterized protein ARMOST_07841 [Armillaria ostoyae]|uniref:Uncharacterized protein n=1 Tax=Armillaria ostoyae TaxID=47428 RepID=A0A284R713_ARMOS|nr:uncharacterized protein ARMOST_07841 [Armillaria ostoyae]
MASVWRNTVPKLAFDVKNQCLLHAILALSALHAHHADPTASQYAIAASAHHLQAKTGVHKADVDAGGYRCLTSYSSDRQITFRTIPPKVAKKWTRLQGGVLRPLFVTLAPTIVSTPFEGQFPSSLSTLLSTMHSPPEIEELYDVSVYAAHEDSIHFLEISWKMSFEKDYCMQRRPRALIILAHYCVMMKRVAMDGPWWARKQWGQ